MRHGFNRGFADQAHEGDWQGWTPPWLDRERHGHGPRGFGRHMRDEFFGRGRHGGPGGHFGPGRHFGPEGHFGEGRNFFGRGDFKFAVLKLLQERPMHGYEMLKTLEERSGGFYTPSAGSIYPTLQLLQDQGLVTVAEAEGKKVYTITDAGRELLAQHEKQAETFAGPPWARGRRGQSPEIQALRSEAGEVARLFMIAGRTAIQNPEKQAQLRAILAEARTSLSDLIYGSSATGSTTSISDEPKA